MLLSIILLSQINSTFASTLNNNANGHLTIFENLGELVPDSAYIHVAIPVTFSHFKDYFFLAKRLLKQDTEDLIQSSTFKSAEWREPQTSPVHEALVQPLASNSPHDIAGLSVAHRIDSIIAQFTNITQLLPTYSLNRPAKYNRERRFIAVALTGLAGIIIGAVMGTFFGQYSQKQMGSISTLQDLSLLLHTEEQHQDMLDNLDRRVHTAFDIFTYNNKVDVSIRALAWQGIVDQLQRRLTQFIQFVTELQRHRLSMTWFSAEQMRNLHNEVVAQAVTHNLTPLTKHLSDYSQLEVSYLTTRTQIIAFMHVPASASQQIWTIYRYIPFPIPLQNSSMLVITASHDIIAVGPDSRHKVMSQSQFDQCRKRNHHFVCESPLVTNTDFATSCVGALMDHNSEAIQQHCTLQHQPIQEQVYQTAANQFAIFAPQTYTARGHCINGTTISALISPTASVNVPSGCTLNLRQHSITVPTNIITTLIPWVQETKWDTFEVPRRLLKQSADNHAHIQRLLSNETTMSSQFHADFVASVQDLQKAHATLAAQLENAQTIHATLLLALACTVVILILALCTCLCCRYCATQTSPFLTQPPQQQ